MALPSFNTPDVTLSLVQSKWAAILDPVIDLPINHGITLKNVKLVTGNNKVNHRLDRKLQGWIIVRKRQAADIYDQQDTNQQPTLTLALNSSADCVVDIYAY
jgi:hypothetical protein